jgi:SAM-dependent methyltransferase
MINYYQNNFNEYHKRTFSADSSSFLSPFVKALSPGVSILDAGCGSGRDLLWLKNQGFQVVGFEQSAGLADLARKHTGCKIIEGDFETYNFTGLKFDAILASGSFVHLPHGRLLLTIQNIRSVLDRTGIFYISLKQGDNFFTDHSNRTFYLWQDAQLREIFRQLNLDVIHFSNTESVLNSNDMWLGYVLKVK